MTNEELFEDLKQFINTKIDTLDVKIDAVCDELKSYIADLDARIDTILDELGGDVVTVQKTVSGHEKRLTKLETASAA
jgi:hypothetical protein